MRLAVVLALAGPLCLAAPARASRLPAIVTAQAVPTGTAIVLDGQFDEPVWEEAPVISEFVQREPAEGQAPSQRTEVRVAYDALALYVAVRAYDTDPSAVVGLLTRRDQRSPSDWIKVAVDSYHDRRSAYEFAVNPVGVKLDRYYFNDSSSDDTWDAVWDVAVARDETGWRAEFRIPFSQLRFNNTTGGPVGFAVAREIGRLAETSTWPLLSRNETGLVSQFGELHGLRMAGTPKRLEVQPYTLGQVSVAPLSAVNALVDRTDPSGSGGLDLKYALTPGLTLTATANPDFGQVEADPAVVNLDAFETFFQERRPFFVEGSGTFRFNMDCNDGECTGLFYSRRIGRAPQGAASRGAGEFAAQPSAATILGAAKLTGRVGRFAVGAITAYTQEEQATIAGGLDRRSQVVEPFSAYQVLRARREFTNRSTLGFMATAANRRLDQAVRFLPESAYSAGMDYDWRIRPDYNLSGYFASSHVRGSTEAITRLQTNAVHQYNRVDAGHVALDPGATAISGHAGAIAFGKIGGERTRFNAHYGYKSPGFDINDLGFQRRADEKTMSHWFQLRYNTPGRFTRSWMVNFNQWAGWNFDGDRTFSGGNINMHWTWQNNWRAGFGVNGQMAPFRDRSTRGGPGVRGNSNVSLWYYMDLDDRRAIIPGYNGYHEADSEGTRRHNFNPRITWRPNSAASVQLGVRYGINDDDAQWVRNEDRDGRTRYVFGRIEQRTVAMTARVNYTVTPTLSIQTYAEPFVSAGAYSSFRELVDGRADDYAARYRAYDGGRSADFNYRSFRTTNVLRWEYRPGSSLFVVWQQGRQDVAGEGDFRFGRDFGDLFSAPSHNVFLVKLSYWFNM
ncbi:MAG: DUF5916 domain-containing protein [Vicinamibacterales bacterium]|nr:DUF5916 domain-containing protein [Vicinamibacterales bacterium]